MMSQTLDKSPLSRTSKLWQQDRPYAIERLRMMHPIKSVTSGICMLKLGFNACIWSGISQLVIITKLDRYLKEWPVQLKLVFNW
jgi:hypothetical protein